MNRSIWQKVSILSLTAVLATVALGVLRSSSFALEQTPQSLFEQGNRAYENEKFQQAIDCYEKLIQAKQISGELYYNVANAYLKSGNVAKAILNYRRAQKYLPRESRVKRNLTIAKSYIKDKISDPSQSVIIDFFKNILLLFTLDEWTWIFFILLDLSVLLLIGRLMLHNPLVRSILFYSGVSSLCILVVVTLFFASQLYISHFTTPAIVMSEEVSVHSGPGEEYTVLFKIHAGTETNVLQKRDAWSRIRLINGYEGWIPTNTVEFI